MQSPEISVIMPVYNTSVFLRRSIESVLNQSFSDFEFIIVDDGSIDISFEICNEYYKSDDRIILLQQENKGQAAARNLALCQARGKYLCFVDSDDFLEINALEIVMDGIKRFGSVCAYFEANIVDSDDNIIGSAFKYFDKTTQIVSKEYLRLLLAEKVGSQPCLAVFRSDFWDGIYFPEGRIYEDIAAVYLVADKMEDDASVLFIHRRLYNYRMNANSTTHSSAMIKKQYDRYLAFKERYDFSVNKKMDIAEKCFSLTVLCAHGVVHACARSNSSNESLREAQRYIAMNRSKILRNPYIALLRKILLLITSVCPNLYFCTVRSILKWGISNEKN